MAPGGMRCAIGPNGARLRTQDPAIQLKVTTGSGGGNAPASRSPAEPNDVPVVQPPYQDARPTPATSSPAVRHRWLPFPS